MVRTSVAGFEQVGGEGVAEGAAVDALGDTGREGGLTEGFLGDALIYTMAAGEAGARIGGEVGGGKDVLPAPLAGE